VLSEDNKSTKLLSERGCHEARVVKEGVDVTLVTCVEYDGAILPVKVGVVNQVAHLVFL